MNPELISVSSELSNRHNNNNQFNLWWSEGVKIVSSLMAAILNVKKNAVA